MLYYMDINQRGFHMKFLVVLISALVISSSVFADGHNEHSAPKGAGSQQGSK